MSDYIYDLETYPNCFTCSVIKEDGTEEQMFECSTRKNEIAKLYDFLDTLHNNGDRMVGFNNVGFDYPILHGLLQVREKAPTVSGKAVATKAYKLAQEQINNQDTFAKTIKVSDEYVRQVDLYKINHFDNKARATSLKMLEFNMRSNTIEDLPFAVGKELSSDEMDKLLTYNMHDVKQTLEFYKHSLPSIKFRQDLTLKYGKDFTNHNDTKIGKDYFIMELERLMPQSCYKYRNGKRILNQTVRSSIKIKDCLFDYYDFERPEFVAVLDWFAKQKITETKGVFSEIPEHMLGDVAKYAQMYTKQKKFASAPNEEDLVEFYKEQSLGWIERKELKAKRKGETVYSYWKCWREADNLNVIVDDFRFDFGTGGIHGSIESTIVESNDHFVIIDADVSSMYPNIAIANRVYPEHLSEKFCDIYEDVYNQRKSYAKGTAENAMLKLALNGVYGDSNNQYSPFYDPKYTMTITINGQLSLCLLAEKLLKIRGLTLIQVNTDGITVKLPRKYLNWYNSICKQWQEQVGLELEFAEYSRMLIKDVNNYLAVYTNGKVKRKGVYQYEGLGWHQDQGALIVPKAAEAYMLHGKDIETFIQEHLTKDVFDFMLRTKVPRNSKLVLIDNEGNEVVQQNICRYYASTNGGKLVKIMPPIEEGGEERRIGIDTEWNVKTCNDMSDFRNDIDVNYYVDAAKKLVIQEATA